MHARTAKIRFWVILDPSYVALFRRAKIVDLSIKMCNLVARFSLFEDSQKQRNLKPSHKKAIKNDTVLLFKMRTLSAKNAFCFLACT